MPRPCSGARGRRGAAGPGAWGGSVSLRREVELLRRPQASGAGAGVAPDLRRRGGKGGRIDLLQRPLGGDEALDGAVLQGVEADHDQATAGPEERSRGGQRALQASELVV